jgi:hypothetical protein
MPRSEPALKIDLSRARAHWHRRQGLAEPVKGAIDEVIAATGWPRTLGGADVYLAVRARIPGMKRVDLEEAVKQSKVQVIPAVRGCIYLVPRVSVPLALRIAEELSAKRSEREHEKAGISQKELADVAEAIVVALRKGPLSTDALRKALPEGVVRSLGEKGKKLGISSTLPPAVRHLEFEGRVERTIDAAGRLDNERYVWRLTAKSPFEGAKVPADAGSRHAQIAEIFFRHVGPVTQKDFAEWSGLSQRDARAAMDRVALAPVEVEGYAKDAFALEADLPALREASPPGARPSMLPFEDNYVVLHGGPACLVDPKHHSRKIQVWGQTKGTTLGDVKHMSMRPLFDGDTLVGMWEYDPDADVVVYGTFDPLPTAKKRAVAALAEDVGAFLRDDIGHAKSFTLDTVEAIRERAAIVKSLG